MDSVSDWLCEQCRRIDRMKELPINPYAYSPYSIEQVPGVYSDDPDVQHRRFGKPVTWDDSYMKKLLDLDINVNGRERKI